MTSPNPRRFRFRFSLLALLILITVVAAFLAGRASLRLQLLDAQSRAEEAESRAQAASAVADTLAEALRGAKLAAATVPSPTPQPRSVAEDLRNIPGEIGAAIGDAIDAGLNEAMAKLEISDEVEAGLLNEAMKGKDLGTPATISLILIRPSESIESQKESEFANAEKHFKVRMIKRSTIRIAQPVGVIVHSAIREGEIVTEQSVVELGEDGQWTNIQSQSPPPQD